MGDGGSTVAVAVVEYTAGTRALLSQWWLKGGCTVSRLGPIRCTVSGWLSVCQVQRVPLVSVADVQFWVVTSGGTGAGCTWVLVQAKVGPDGGKAWYPAAATFQSLLLRITL